MVQHIDTALDALEPLAARNVGCTAYAVTYLMHIPEALAEAMVMGNSERFALKVQLLYALSNMQAWRGPVARTTKAALKAFATQPE